MGLDLPIVSELTVSTLLREILALQGEGTTLSRSELRDALTDTRFDWFDFLKFAGENLITPSIYILLNKVDLFSCLEQSIQDALQQVYRANVKRNKLILTAFEDFTLILNSIDVHPIPLKGAGFLLDGTYDHIGERIVSDIDVLVQPKDLKRVLVALRDSGYLQKTNPLDPINVRRRFEYVPIDVSDFRNQHAYISSHVPGIYSPEFKVNIEFHTSVCTIKDHFSELLSQIVWQGAEKHTTGQLTTRRATSSFHLLHNFYHSQIAHKYQKLFVVDYRHLIDFYHLLIFNSDGTGPADINSELIKECLQSAKTSGFHDEICIYLWQLENYCGLRVFSRYVLDVDSRNVISNYKSQKASRFIRFYNKISVWIMPRISILNIWGWSKRLYGPIPAHTRIYKYIRYQFLRHVQRSIKFCPYQKSDAD